MNYKETIRFSSQHFPKDFYLVLGCFSNQGLNPIPPGGMVSEGDVGGSDLLSKIIRDDLHLVVPEDSNTGIGLSQVDAHSTSRLHLELDEIVGLITEILKY